VGRRGGGIGSGISQSEDYPPGLNSGAVSEREFSRGSIRSDAGHLRADMSESAAVSADLPLQNGLQILSIDLARSEESGRGVGEAAGAQPI
jgi:hypothetical protein